MTKKQLLDLLEDIPDDAALVLDDGDGEYSARYLTPIELAPTLLWAHRQDDKSPWIAGSATDKGVFPVFVLEDPLWRELRREEGGEA